MQPFDRGFFALGLVVGGVALTALFILLEWFGYTLPVANQYFAAIMGALVGGSIAIVGQLLTIQYSTREKAQELEAKNAAILLSLWEKVREIHSNLTAFKKHLSICGKSAEENDVQLCIAVTPLSWHGNQILFSPDEKALLLLWKEHELYNQVSHLDLLAIGNVKHFAKYEEDRAKLWQLGKLSNVEGKIVIDHLPEHKDEISARIAVLDDGLRVLKKNLDTDLGKAIVAIEMLEKLLRIKIDRNLTFEAA